MSQSVAVAPKRLTKTQACERLGIGPVALDRLIKVGELKALVIPGLRVTVLQSSVDALVARMNEVERRAG